MQGLKTALLYGFYPCQLGLCGPKENSLKELFLNYLSGQEISESKIRKILKSFKSAFAYYKLIAQCNKISNPFDERVVRAYWLGNKLLENVPLDALRRMIVREFSKPGLLSKKVAEKRAKEIPLNSKPHHSFHVLVLGAVSSGVVLEGKMLDLCRIGWGRVVEIKEREKDFDNKVVIKYQPLYKKRKRYFLGKEVQRVVSWDKIFLPRLKKGDIVSTHWNHIAQSIKKPELSNLKKYTQITINSLNG